MKKQVKKMPKRIICPYCGGSAVLREDKYVHGDNGKGKLLYVCKNYPVCDSYVGVHEGTKVPLGTLANAELRNKRIRAHKLFDAVWKNRIMSKKEAYRWIQCMFGIAENDAHIGKFSDYRCDELMRNCTNMLDKNNIAFRSA